VQDQFISNLQGFFVRFMCILPSQGCYVDGDDRATDPTIAHII